MRRALTTSLLALWLAGFSAAQATVRLGDPLPTHPWPAYGGDELVVLYSHDCGDLRGVWPALMIAELPLHAVNAEEVATPTPSAVSVWRGPQATQFSRQLRVQEYPTALLVRGGRIWQVWQGAAAIQRAFAQQAFALPSPVPLHPQNFPNVPAAAR